MQHLRAVVESDWLTANNHSFDLQIGIEGMVVDMPGTRHTSASRACAAAAWSTSSEMTRTNVS